MKYWLLRCIDVLTKIIIAGFIAIVILVATTVSLVRYYLPLVENYHYDILQFINESSDNFEIRANSIQGSINGLSPEISLHDVTVLAKGQDEAIKISELRLSIDVIRTLSWQKLFFENLYLSNLDLMLVQSDAKLWGLRTVANKSTSEPPKVRRLVEQLWAIDNLTINNINITLDSYDSDPVKLPTTFVKLVTSFNTKKLYVEVLNQKNSTEPLLELYARANYSPYDKRFKLRSDIKFNEINIVKHLPILSSQFGLDNIEVSAKASLKYEAKQVTAEGEVQLSDLLYKLNKAEINVLSVEELASNFRLSMSENSSSLALNNTNLTLLGSDLSIPHVKITSAKDADSLYVDRINVAALNQLAIGLWGQSESKVISYLKGLNASGFVNDIYLTVDEKQWQDFSMVAVAEKVNIDFYNNIPEIKNASGELALSARQGEFNVNSEDFTLHLANIFSEAYQLDTAKGWIGWEIYPSELDQIQRLSLSGKNLLLSGDIGNAVGEFILDLPLKTYTENSQFQPPTLSLQMALENTGSEYLPQFLPLMLADSITDWIHGSVKTAQVSRANFIYHGTASRFSDLAKVKQLELEVDNAEVSYLAEWPVLKNITGSLRLDDSDIQAQITGGSILGAQVKQAQLSINKDVYGNTMLTANGKYQASSAQGIELLGIKPIAETTGDLLQNWQLSSEKNVVGGINISHPLAVKNVKYKPVTDVEVSAQLLNFEFENIAQDLRFSHVNSNIAYSLSKGLSANQLTFNFLGEAFSGRVESLMSRGKLKSTHLYFDGSLAQKTLSEWLKQPILDFATGRLPINGNVYFGEQGSGLKIVSDLQGLSLNLPEPFSKKTMSTMPLEIEFPLTGKERVLTARLNNFANIQFRVADQGFDAGRIILGIKHAPFEKNKLLIGGQINSLELEQWLNFVEKYTQSSRRQSSHAKSEPLTKSAKAPGWHIKVDDLSVRYLSAFDQHLERAQISAIDNIDYWSISLDHDLLKLKSRIFNDKKPIELNIEFADLSFIQKEGQAESSTAAGLIDELNAVESNTINDTSDLDSVISALSSKQMAGLPDINVQVAQLALGEEDFGKWEFKLRASANKITLSELKGLVRGMGVIANPNGPAFLSWSLEDDTVEDEEISTVFSGRLQGENLTNVLKAWGYPPQVNSKSFVFDADLKWLGAPTDYAFENLNGSIDLSLKKGSFVDASSSSTGALKFVGALSLDNLLRRLRLDFSDLTDKGLSYDAVTGKLILDSAVVFFDQKPIEIVGSSSNISLLGQADFKQEIVDFELSVTLPLASNLPWVVALAAGLPTAAGVYVISKLMKTQVEKLSSAIYQVSGSFSDPEVKFTRLFDKH